MRALPFFLILLIVALALWIVQAGDPGGNESLTRPGDPAAAGAVGDVDSSTGAGVRGGAAADPRGAGGARAGARERFMLRVRVIDGQGRGLAAARVTLAFDVGGEPGGQRVLGLTADDGRLELPVDAFDRIAPALAHDTTWRVEAWAAGHVRGGVSGSLEEARRLDVEVQLARGATLRGRVVDLHGAPVAGATADVQVLTSAGGLQPVPADGVRTDAEGRFVLAAQPGRRGALVAYDAAHGYGLLHPLDVGKDTDVGDIALEPLGTLGGRVTNRDGSPARHVRVGATLQVIDRAATRELQRAQREVHRLRVFESVEKGRFAATAYTGEQGRFRIAGLFPGRYEVQAQAQVAALGVDAYDPSRIHTTPSDSLELTIDATRLLVELRDAAGAPVPGLEVLCRLLDDTGAPADDTQLGASWTETTGGPRGRAAFAVEAGRRYVLAVQGHGAFAVEREVLASGAPEQVCVVELPAAGAVGELAVDLRDSAGNVWNDWRATLRGRRLGQPVLGFRERAPDADGVLRGVPAGEWTIEITAAGTEAGQSFLWLPDARVDTTIVGGERRTLALTGAEGARVRVVLDGSGLADARPPGPDPALNAKRLQSQGVWIFLRPADGGELITVHCLDERVSSEPTRRTLPGCAAEGRGAIAPGDYTLLVNGPGVVQHQEEIVLRAGQVTERTVVLQQR